ncbi:MAG: polysaccharide biosynthesis C-terminal domain-containing protein, partial [Nitratireductor sp.]|nr:polysaccharide biosynthesis C-terminal domain-containing protein [Nitratireductor sp.]
MSSAEKNPFLQGTLPGLFVRTAAPILLVMATNGLVNIADAWYLGRYTGQPALTAVTIVFPLYLVMIALATLVGGGMASMLARALGADEEEQARIVFSSANWLALIAAIIVAAVFQLFGTWTTLALSGGNAMLADAGHTYLEILVWGSPVFFVLSVNGDAFRCEGRMNLVAAIALLVNAANIAFNYVLIARLGYGVAGAATGTVLAQCTALVFAASIRRRDKGILACQRLKWRLGSMEASRILALGAPQSLTFLGLSVHASAVLFMLQQHAGDSYSATVAAYGIVSRIMTFLYLPM